MEPADIKKELLKIIPTHQDTQEGDLVVFMMEAAASYAQVLEIVRDDRKVSFGEWWHVTFLFFTFPPQVKTIILRTEQINGVEDFTMDGEWRSILPIDMERFYGKYSSLERKEEKKAHLSLVKGRGDAANACKEN